VLVAGDDRRDDDERDDHPDEDAEGLAVLDAFDHLADQQRLGEGDDRAHDAEHGDEDEHAGVLEEEGEELAEARPGAVVGGGAAAAARDR